MASSWTILKAFGKYLLFYLLVLQLILIHI